MMWNGDGAGWHRVIFGTFGSQRRADSFLVPALLAANFALTAAAAERVTLPPTVEVPSSWDKSIRFIANRGPGAVVFLQEVQSLFEPSMIAKMAGFPGWKNVRGAIKTYEFRSMEVLASVTALLELGAEFQIVDDGTTHHLFELATAKQLAKWSPEQRDYYRTNYDRNGDGVVDEADVEAIRARNELTRLIREKVLELRDRFPQQLELISSPHETVPNDPSRNYPRMQHFKRFDVSFRDARDAKVWHPQKAIIPTSNATDSCLGLRVAPSQVNFERYLNNEPYKILFGSEGNIQFGAVITGQEILEALSGPTEKWVDLYRLNRHFDEARQAGPFPARVVFTEKKAPTPSILEAFYSEGLRTQPSGEPEPFDHLTQLLLQPEIKIRAYLDAQFVMSHARQAKSLRQKLASSELEDFGIFVDSSFSTELYSTLPDFLFSTQLNLTHGTLRDHAVRDNLPLGFDWTKNVFSFEGNEGIYGKRRDLLHPKLTYVVYEDEKNIRHYLVLWGSANKSIKSSRINADALVMLDSTDPKVGASLDAFFKGLRAEKRMRPFGQAWLERRLLERFRPDPQIFTDAFLRRFEKVLSQKTATPLRTSEFRDILRGLQGAGAKNKFGEAFLHGLEWFLDQASRELDWSELDLLFKLSQRRAPIEVGVRAALVERWLPARANPAQTKKLDLMLRGFNPEKKSPRVPVSDALARILHNCQNFLLRVQPGADSLEGSPAQ